MKINKHIRWIFQLAGVVSLSVLVLMAGVGSGCQKARLFVHSDTLQSPPSQFHFFNAFAYDSSLNFSVDGKLREQVGFAHFSGYYPTTSAFNQDPTQPNGKYITISDPRIQTQFAGFNTFQFAPTTSYVVFPFYNAYDTSYSPINSIVPNLTFYPEDVETPFDGTCRVRYLDLVPGLSNTAITMTPNTGAGTTLSLPEIYNYNGYTQPQSASSTYTGTQPGMKNISITLGYGGINVRFTYLPIQLDSKNYTFFLVGDVKNFLAGLQPRPRMFVSADGDPSGLRELVLSATSYPGNLGATAAVTVVNDAFNIPGQVLVGDPNSPTGNFVTYDGLDVNFNQTPIHVYRWPIVPTSSAPIEDVFDNTKLVVNTRMNSKTGLVPGPYVVTMVPDKTYTPVYDKFDLNLEAGLSYTVCLLPQLDNISHASHLVMQNDQSPSAGEFRLRIINLFSGAPQIDVHNDSPSGSLLTSSVPYAQATNYLSLTPGTVNHDLYVTAAGSTTPLFQTDTLGNHRPITLSYTGGNSGTLYIMGLLPGTPYVGSVYYWPYVIYVSDAAINPNAAMPSQQLYY